MNVNSSPKTLVQHRREMSAIVRHQMARASTRHATAVGDDEQWLAVLEKLDSWRSNLERHPA